MELGRNKRIIEKLHKTDLHQYRNLSMLFDMVLAVKNDDLELAKSECRHVKNLAAMGARKDLRFQELYWRAVLFLAQNRDLDSYLLYLERYRDPEDRFYLPRRNQLRKLGLIQAMQNLIDDKMDILTISCPPGVGKAQPLYSKVLTPNGFKRMGDVSIGTKVISGTGKLSTVTGIFPQGKKPVYELTFDDGSKCRCSDEHLWKVQTRDDRRTGKYRVVTLRDMMKNLYVENGKRANYSIDYVEKIDFPERNLPLHPYVMGALLGDGGFTSGNVRFSNPDEQIVKKVMSLLPESDCMVNAGASEIDYRIRRMKRSNKSSDTYSILDRYGLIGCHSRDKFIPPIYLLGSYEQRKELLAGLLDTDGCVCSSVVEYDTTSMQMASNVVDLVHSLGGYASIRFCKAYYSKSGTCIQCNDSYRILIQFDSAHCDCFSLDRKKERYKPKRTIMKRFLKSIEYIGEEECQCIMIDDESHLYITDNCIITHNTTLAEMFLSGWIGWDPDACNLFSSHSGHVTRMVYDVVCNIIGADLKQGQISEYAWKEIFPDVNIESVNAKEETINLGKFKAFKSITFRALGASQTGVTRAEGLLYCDDLCSGIEEALSNIRLDKLWTKYSTDLKTRKKAGRKGKKCKELHIATRWSVWDVIGRLIKLYTGNKRCKFISLPDIDPETGKSNWDYQYGVGFDEEYFEDIQQSLDEITYKCLFKNDPIEREGLLFAPDTLRRFKKLPPDKEPDAIWGFLDPKGTGTDYNCLGIFYQYGQDYYLSDVVFQNIDPYVLDGVNARSLVRNNVQICQVESNKEGVRTGDAIQEEIDALGGRCVIEKKLSSANKETRIIVNSPWVIKHVLFLEPKTPDYPDGYLPNSEYGNFMSHLTSYSQLSKNPTDDAPDMVTMLAIHEGGFDGTVTETMTRQERAALGI